MQPIAERHSERRLARELRSQRVLPDHIDSRGIPDRVIDFLLRAKTYRLALHPGQITEIEPSIASNWDALPPHTLLAVKTKSWNHWVLHSPLKQRGHKRVIAGDY